MSIFLVIFLKWDLLNIVTDDIFAFLRLFRLKEINRTKNLHSWYSKKKKEKIELISKNFPVENYLEKKCNEKFE